MQLKREFSKMNKVILVGRLGEDPKRISEQTVVFNLATQNGKEKPPTWHKVKVWDKQATSCLEFLKKGNAVAVEGSINNYQFTQKDGSTGYGSEINAHRVEFLSPPEKKQENGYQGNASSNSYHRDYDDVGF